MLLVRDSIAKDTITRQLPFSIGDTLFKLNRILTV
jgi:hypothetical protein